MTAPNCRNRFQVLCYDQVVRLNEVMEDVVPVHGRGNFPTLDVKLRELVQVVREKLASDGVKVSDVRLNGGAASYILGSTSCQEFNDLDLIFGVDLINHNELQKIRNCVLECLLDFLPEGVSKEKMSSCSLKEAYVQKMVKAPMSEHFYPTVVAESVYGDFTEAWYHLNNKLIATRNPEEIRGGGLLKYCNLLVKGFLPAEDVDIRTMERYMCSRFFIDFSDINQQRQKLEAYLANHFGCDETTKYHYLMTLYQVVDESTICLMGHERRQTLSLIQQLAYQVMMTQERKAQVKCIELHELDQLNNLVIDQVFYGPFASGTNGSQYYSYAAPSSTFGHQISSSSSCPFCPPFLACS